MVSREEYLEDNLRYDPETGFLWWKTPLGKRDLTKPVGSVDGRGYLQVNTPYGNLKLHRVGWFLHYGSWAEGQLDHINGCKTDNRLCNLRLCNNQQNSLNGSAHKDSLYSKYKGVTYDKRSKKYMARFSNKFLGYFIEELDAAKAYNDYLESLNNEFTKKNDL